MSLALVSCSDQSSEQSIYLPKDLHSSKREIAITAEYDAQVQEDSATGWLMGEKLFQAETELLIRGEQSGPASNIVPTKLPSSRSRQTGGFGLGLSLVKRIAELHEGTVVASNESNGFFISLVLPLGKNKTLQASSFL